MKYHGISDPQLRYAPATRPTQQSSWQQLVELSHKVGKSDVEAYVRGVTNCPDVSDARQNLESGANAARSSVQRTLYRSGFSV